jgi:hypothetical protein
MVALRHQQYTAVQYLLMAVQYILVAMPVPVLVLFTVMIIRSTQSPTLCMLLRPSLALGTRLSLHA